MANKNVLTDKSIVFIGFMGVGKTTVARLVAKKLGREFIDIDLEIEKAYGLPTTKIFKKVGEQAFREKEKEFALHYAKQPLKIVSLGGGAFLQKEIREVCLDKAIVIFLDISWESWKKRLHILVDSRPVLQNKSLAEIEALFRARKDSYKEHTLRIMTDGLSQEAIANSIIDSLQSISSY